jgi:Protein of unknown function (DUF3800)
MATHPKDDDRPRPELPRKRFHVFADESATDSQYPCYGIGALVVPESRLAAFNEYASDKLVEHGVVGEARWKKVDSSHGLANFAIELWREVVSHPFVRFGAIIVRKDLYRKWHEDKEDAFYTTYTFLLRHVAKVRLGAFDVVIDNRSDSYEKRDEVLGIVSNHMLRGLKSDSEITRVEKHDSRLLLGLQVADLFTGAITHAHAMGLESRCVPNAGKQLLMARMAGLVGWKDLYCDTMPDSGMNIWHFPEEWRATPETREVHPTRAISFITPTELRGVRP